MKFKIKYIVYRDTCNRCRTINATAREQLASSALSKRFAITCEISGQHSGARSRISTSDEMIL